LLHIVQLHCTPILELAADSQGKGSNAPSVRIEIDRVKVLCPTRHKIGHLETWCNTEEPNKMKANNKRTKLSKLNQNKSSAIAEKADRCICLLLADRRHPYIL